jgi:membrane protease YdiL (CAAX protease family)
VEPLADGDLPALAGEEEAAPRRTRAVARADTPGGTDVRWALFGVLAAGVAAQVGGGVAMGVAAVFKILWSGGELVPASLQRAALGDYRVVAFGVVCTGAYLFGVAALFVKSSGVSLRRGLGLAPPPLVPLLVAPLGMLALAPTASAFRSLMMAVAPDLTFGAVEGLEVLVRATPVALAFFVFAMVPGLCEEVVFRGLLQRSMVRPKVALVVSGVLFAVYHLDPHHVAAVLPLGLYLSWLVYRTGSLWVAVGAHTFNNGFAVLLTHLLPPEEAESFGEELWLMPLGWLVLAGVVALVHRFAGPPPARSAFADGGPNRRGRAIESAPPSGAQ